MALPLTDQTEPVLVTRLRCRPSMDIDQEIEDLAIEAGHHIRIDRLEDRRDPGRMNTRTDLEETHEDSRSTTKTLHKTTNDAHEFPTKISIAPRLLLSYAMMIKTDVPRRDQEQEAGHPTDKIVEETDMDEGDSQGETIGTEVVEMRTVDLTPMETVTCTVGMQRTCQ